MTRLSQRPSPTVRDAGTPFNSAYNPPLPPFPPLLPHPRPGSKSPSAAARSRRRPALPWETPRVAFTSLTVIPREKSSAACWKIGREGILPNGRSLSVRQICTKSIHRPSRRAQAPTAPQCERAAIGPSIARQDHVFDDRIDLGLPALAGEHAVVAYAGLHVVALKIGSQLAA